MKVKASIGASRNPYLSIATIAAVIVLLHVGLTQEANSTSWDDDDYSRVLDSYFDHARALSPSAVTLRVYGGLDAEYEIVVDPELSPRKLTRWRASKPIWGNAFDAMNGGTTQLSVEGYAAKALRIPIEKADIAIPEEEIREFWRRAQVIDLTITEKRPFKDSKGRDAVLTDVPYLEIISRSGKVRGRITDTHGTDIVSCNAAFLDWAVDLEKAAVKVR